MISYEIRINISSLLHYSASLKDSLDNETLLTMIRSFSIYVRDRYKSLVYDEIYSKRYKGEWEPINDEGYLEYLGTPPTRHILDLIDEAIEIREVKDSVVIRFNRYYKYPGSKHSLESVIKAIDNGTSKFNARPLVKWVVHQMNRELPTLWRMYLRKRGVH